VIIKGLKKTNGKKVEEWEVKGHALTPNSPCLPSLSYSKCLLAKERKRNINP